MTDQQIALKPTKPVTLAPVESSGNPIMDMAMEASRRNDVAMVKELLAIRDSEDAKAAERAFNSAYAKAQAEMPIIPKRGKGHNNIEYARIEDIMQAVMPVLANHGLSLRHKTAEQGGAITITAILAHVDGHSETDTFTGEADKTGSKNSIQAKKSTITYGRRTTAENILGLASHGEDDDAFAAGDSVLMSEWRARIGGLKTVEQANDARADLMASTDVTNEERTKIGHVWTAKFKTLKAA